MMPFYGLENRPVRFAIPAQSSVLELDELGEEKLATWQAGDVTVERGQVLGADRLPDAERYCFPVRVYHPGRVAVVAQVSEQ